MSGGGFNNMISQLGQPQQQQPQMNWQTGQPVAQPTQPAYQSTGPNTGWGGRSAFTVNPNTESLAQATWLRGPEGATAAADVNARNLAALPEDQRAGYKPISNQEALNQTLRENIQAGMGNYGKMVQGANQYGTSEADIQRAIGPNTDMYTYMNRPNYQQYSPNGQFNQPIYQSNYQNYNTGNPMGVSQYGQGPDYYGMGLAQQMNTPFNPYTNSYQTPFSAQQAPTQPNYGPSRAIVSRSAGMRGTPNVVARRAEGGIASLMDNE